MAIISIFSACTPPTPTYQGSFTQTSIDSRTPTEKIVNQENNTKTPQSTPTNSYFALGEVTANLCNLRKGPGVGYEIVGYTEIGEVHKIYGTNSERTWLLIDRQMPVWISSTLISLDTDVTNIPIVEEFSSPDKPKPVKTPTKTKILSPTKTTVVYPTKTKAIPQPTQVPGCPIGCPDHPPGCDIKGNISLYTGEKIYHVPGGEFYDECVINPEKWERWFCTEQEAINNGWRKSQK